MIKFAKKIALFLWYFIAVLIIFIAVLGAVLKAATPILNQHKADVEDFLSEKLNQKITIGKIDAKWARFGPEFHLHHIAVYRGDQVFIKANNLTAHIGIFRTLATKEVYFRELILDKVNLDIVETQAHQYTLNGFKLFQSDQDFNPEMFLHWLGVQNRLQVTNVSLKTQLLAQAEYKTIVAQMALYKDRQHDGYALTAAGEINQDKNSPFKLISHFQGTLANFKQLQGDIYLSLQHVPLALLSPLVEDYGSIKQGDINISLWAKTQSDQLQAMQAKLFASDVKLAKDERELVLNKFSAVFGWFPERDNHGWKLITKDLQVKTAGHSAQNMQFMIQHGYKQGQNQEQSPARLSLSNIQIDSVLELAKFWGGVPKQTQELLDRLSPSGVINKLVVKVPHNTADIMSYLFKAELGNLSNHEHEKYPGISNLTGVLEGSLSNGCYSLNLKNSRFAYQHYFPKALEINQGDFNGAWRYAPEKLTFILDRGLVKSNSIDADASLFLSMPLGENKNQAQANNQKIKSKNAAETQRGQSEKSLLSLVGGFSAKNSQDIVNSLPLNLFSPAVNKWLTHSLGNGQGADGTVVIRGALEHFPYANNQGSFIVYGKLRPLELNYLDEWPVIHGLEGDIVFHNQSMFGNITHGVMSGINITQAKVAIENLLVSPHLVITGKTHESTENAFEFIHQSPLNNIFGRYLESFDLKGELSVTLRLDLPLLELDAEHISTSGNIIFENNQLVWVRKEQSNQDANVENITLEKLNGQLHFENDIVSSEKLGARFEGMPVDFSVATVVEKGEPEFLEINASGSLSAQGLAAITNWKKLVEYAKGISKFQSRVSFPVRKGNYIGFEFNSSLQGIAIDLPGVFKKAQEQIKSLSLNAELDPKTFSGQFAIDYQDTINSIVHFQNFNKSDYLLQVDARVPLFTWPLPQSSFAGFNNDKSKSEPQSGSASKAESFFNHLTELKLKIDKLNLYNNPIEKISLNMRKSGQRLMWTIDSPVAKGSVQTPEIKTNPVMINLDYLTIAVPKNKNTKVSESNKSSSKKVSLVTALKAKSWWPLAININKLSYNQYYFGEVLLKTKPMTNGIAIENLTVNNPLYKINLTGQWEQVGEGQISHLKGLFSTDDLGKVFVVNKLFSSDTVNNIQAKKTRLNFDLSWPDNLWTYQLAKLKGDVRVTVDDGVIPINESAAKMGLGKVLSLFSTQSLERRLKLDFSDLSDQGYSFNTMETKLNLNKGNAYVQEGMFDGPQAKVDFSGRIGLAAKDYDLSLVVTPYLTSTVPVLAAFAGGPVVGVAAYAVNKLAGSTVAKLTSYHYLLHGPWAKPELVNLDQADDKNGPKETQENKAPAKTTDVANTTERRNFGRSNHS